MDVLIEVLIEVATWLAVVLVPAAYYAWRRRRGYYIPWALAYWLAIFGVLWGFSIGKLLVLPAAVAILMGGLLDALWLRRHAGDTQFVTPRAHLHAARIVGIAGTLVAIISAKTYYDWTTESTGYWYWLVVISLALAALIAIWQRNRPGAWRAVILLGVLGALFALFSSIFLTLVAAVVLALATLLLGISTQLLESVASSPPAPPSV